MVQTTGQIAALIDALQRMMLRLIVCGDATKIKLLVCVEYREVLAVCGEDVKGTISCTTHVTSIRAGV